MSAPIKPLADRVVAVREQAETKTASGLYLPDNAKEKSLVATVAAAGPDVKSLKVGDRIVYKEYSTTELKIDGTEYLVIKEEDVLATLACVDSCARATLHLLSSPLWISGYRCHSLYLTSLSNHVFDPCCPRSLYLFTLQGDVVYYICLSLLFLSLSSLVWSELVILLAHVLSCSVIPTCTRISSLMLLSFVPCSLPVLSFNIVPRESWI